MPSQKDRSHLNNNFIPIIPTEIAITQYGDFSDVTTVNSYTGPNSIIKVIYPWTDNPTKLSGPLGADLPTGNAFSVAWSPNGEFLAVGHTNSAFITIYDRNSINFTKLSGPLGSELPAGFVAGVAWSNQCDLLAIAHGSSSFITIYTRSDNSFTKVSGPAAADLPVSSGLSVDFSPNGQFLAVGSVGATASTPIRIYERSSSTIFTKLPNPTNPQGNVNGVAFSPDGQFLALAHDLSSFITIYQNNIFSFTKVSGPIAADLPAQSAFGVAWSPDGRYLAVAYTNSPFITVYKRSGTIFTKLSGQPFSEPEGTGNVVKFSPNGQFLAVGYVSSSFITIYHLQNDLLKRLPTPSVIPTGGVAGISWSPDQQFLALAHTNSSFITVYQTIETPPKDPFNGVVKIIGVPLDGS